MKKLPIDVSSFDIMMSEGYLYIDKTKQIYSLLTSGGRFFFLSRPRRFGKSLLISTLKHLFKGHKQLFKDLWIGSSDYQWHEYPVIELNFSRLAVDSPDSLKETLSRNLEDIGATYGVDITTEPTLGEKLTRLVRELSKQSRVVILVDEYDYPILNNIDKVNLAQQNRDVMQNFFTVLKSLDTYLQGIFITGVTKFSKTSIFSGLNNLNDISLKPRACDLLGYTQGEIEKNLKQYVELYAQEHSMSADDVYKQMKVWYNGYRFSKAPAQVYNPYSVLYYLFERSLENYWLESGTPTFLIKILSTQYKNLEHLELVELSSESLSTVEIDDIPLITLLFQAGYLTISEYNHDTRRYKLDYPNEEVKVSFNTYLLSAFSHTNLQNVESALSKIRYALQNNNIPQFCKVLQSLLAHIPYQLHIGQERYYHSLFQLIGSLIPFDVDSEVPTDKGRVDLVIKTETHIYLFELKLNVTAQDALKQIKTKRYYEKYTLDGRQIVLVGLSFSTAHDKLTLSCDFEELI